jgi:hypothetical protein
MGTSSLLKYGRQKTTFKPVRAKVFTLELDINVASILFLAARPG